MDQCWENVREFHRCFDSPVAEHPAMLTEDRVEKRYRWMLEELDEFKESADVYEQADAMIDLIYFALGTLVEMGVRPQKVFDAVHQANMDKIWPDGLVHHGPDGKVIKSPAWRDPAETVRAIIDSQSINR